MTTEIHRDRMNGQQIETKLPGASLNYTMTDVGDGVVTMVIVASRGDCEARVALQSSKRADVLKVAQALRDALEY